MVTKELFLKCIDTIKDHRAREKKFIEGLDALSPMTYNNTFLYSDYEAFVVDLLTELLGDTAETLSWWIYETDFGANEQLNLLIDEDVRLDTAEKVYDYLTKK